MSQTPNAVPSNKVVSFLLSDSSKRRWLIRAGVASRCRLQLVSLMQKKQKTQLTTHVGNWRSICTRPSCGITNPRIRDEKKKLPARRFLLILNAAFNPDQGAFDDKMLQQRESACWEEDHPLCRLHNLSHLLGGRLSPALRHSRRSGPTPLAILRQVCSIF